MDKTTSAENILRPEKGQTWRHRQYGVLWTVTEVTSTHAILTNERGQMRALIELLNEHYEPQ